MEAGAASVAFAEAFCAGDLAGLEALLAPDLRLRGPLFEFDSREAYLNGLRADPPDPGECDVLEVVASSHQAAILYRYQRPGSRLLVAQFNRLRDGRIFEVDLVFDSASLPR